MVTYGEGSCHILYYIYSSCHMLHIIHVTIVYDVTYLRRGLGEDHAALNLAS